MKEIWKVIPEFDGYEVSNLGRVRSKRRKILNGRGGHRIVPEKVLKLSPGSGGYYRVVLCRNNKYYNRLVHRLTLFTFRRMPKEGEQCRHLDGNRTNNSLNNLCWGTALENVEDKKKHGNLLLGERNGKAKLGEREVREIRSLYAGGSGTHRSIAKKFGITHTNVGSIVRRRTWKRVK